MSKIASNLKPFFFALLGFFAAVGLLSFSHVGPVQAQSPGVNLAQLVAQVNALQSTVTSQGSTITSLKNQQAADEQTISSLKSQEQSDIKNTQNQEQSDIKNVQSQEKSDFTKLNGSVIALQTLTAPLSLSSDPNVGGTNTLLTIKGVNVQIVNGMNSTETQNGLGNLILGYNENQSSQRTGSHNIVAGPYNSYTSSAGMVVGYKNTSSNLEAVALGEFNTASGLNASVSGGINITQNNSTGWSGGSYHSP